MGGDGRSMRRRALLAAARSVELRAAPAATRTSGAAALIIAGAVPAIAHRIAGRGGRRATRSPPPRPASVAGVIEINDHGSRVAAALRGAIAAQAGRDASGAAGDMLVVAESIAAC